ncbi:MAG: thiamine biosynthesis protein [Pseudonocardiales bacterium]|nr:thiamine biosynthesis protein [Jatrophihabitantaceae bacterium]MCW2604985.1 thiamine biosynthesis protein [Pseudonocardiales bacterium]
MTTKAAALPLRRVEECMGTVFSFDVRAAGVESADLEEVVDWLHWVDANFSTYRSDSAISRLAALGRARTADGCREEVRHVLARCEELREATNGYFDAYATGRLDPSGYVKGWAIERASDMLIERGSTRHCINGGGDVQVIGGQAHCEPWQIGIAHPLHPGTLAAVIVGDDLAVATSGSAERGTHIFDPVARAEPGYWSSVTLVGRRIAECDAYATAAFAMGEAAMDWVESLAGYEAFAIAVTGRTWASSGLS